MHKTLNFDFRLKIMSEDGSRLNEPEDFKFNDPICWVINDKY